ncbi:MAG: imidazole glycerol phosphate synthase subunit HisH [Rhodospirillaceae bacterium]|jgi:imidazole glycerol-phosphate synthase subunit HisH|nr:imidazole glycerol phosphate synthase subunit HisH [Rhodospirillaceae bacterium]MBT5195406.1 imidazole glycerol phosphate synthase subunit HisH [Rhodospirillaceae bacterium]MBT5899228.1 imidazole glycerol phosphate synthase subunit HisH [Rhodospirillaceae bacterium]MBT7759881.1 imidazole glycerol phosphate synthase subunit HisH [Rhodospirillaceae bacterium]
MRVAIVDYGSGNLCSAEKAFERAGQDHDGTVDVVVTADAETVAASDRVVLPGVGAFADCRQGLGAVDGMVEALEEFALRKARPFLGICVGMQLLAERGLEHGSHDGLGWIGGEVRAIEPGDPRMKVPHMGWNALRIDEDPADLFAGIGDGAHVYFVHSYGFVPTDPAHIKASVDYGPPIVASLGRDNIAGTQFHPEKSQAVGLRFIANFLSWSP